MTASYHDILIYKVVLECHCHLNIRGVPETGIKGRDKWSHPTVSVECNYLSLPLIPVSGTVNVTWLATNHRALLIQYFIQHPRDFVETSCWFIMTVLLKNWVGSQNNNWNVNHPSQYKNAICIACPFCGESICYWRISKTKMSLLQSFDGFFGVSLTDLLNKQSNSQLFEMLLCSYDVTATTALLQYPSMWVSVSSFPLTGSIHLHIDAETKWPPFSRRQFKWIFLNENVWILIEVSLKFVPKGPINNIPALIQIMAWRRLGDKPLYEPMMVSLLTHIYVTRPQWVKWKHIRSSIHFYIPMCVSFDIHGWLLTSILNDLQALMAPMIHGPGKHQG